MKRNLKLIIGIIILVSILGIIGGVYYFNSKNKEEVLEEAESVGIIKITDENFTEEVINSSEPVILEFSSNSCPPCVAMLTTLINIAKNNKDIKVATLNVDSTDCTSLVKRFPTSGTPTIMIFKDGKKISTLVGAVSEEKIMSELK